MDDDRCAPAGDRYIVCVGQQGGCTALCDMSGHIVLDKHGGCVDGVVTKSA